MSNLVNQQPVCDYTAINDGSVISCQEEATVFRTIMFEDGKSSNFYCQKHDPMVELAIAVASLAMVPAYVERGKGAKHYGY